MPPQGAQSTVRFDIDARDMIGKTDELMSQWQTQAAKSMCESPSLNGNAADHGHSDLLTTVAEQVAHASDLQTLARPLLDILQQMTGLQSVYLTEIDW